MADTLVLNADGAPISILPLSVITWQESIRYMVLGKADVLEWHEDWIVRSARWETRVPSVIMIREYMKKKTNIRYSKQNVFLRDKFKCQYCATDVNKRSATLDHVQPVSKGGKSVWENSTTACGPCNSRKGHDSKMKPKSKPYKPSFWELVENRKKLPFELKHPNWATYISY
jgi:5-methylcytosine-specific restriction endonuclease McrA